MFVLLTPRERTENYTKQAAEFRKNIIEVNYSLLHNAALPIGLNTTTRMIRMKKQTHIKRCHVASLTHMV